MRAAAACAALLAATTTVGCAAAANPDPGQSPTAKGVTVYVFEDGDQPRLHPHSVPVAGEATVEAAVEALTTYEPREPFATLWAELCALGSNLDEVTISDDLITVHFHDNAGAVCDLSQEGWQMRRQQIAWTVRTATGSGAPVRVTTGEDRYQAEEAVVAQEKFLADAPESAEAVVRQK